MRFIEKTKKTRYAMPEWMDCTWRRVPCGRTSCPICRKIERHRMKHFLEEWLEPYDFSGVGEGGEGFEMALEMVRDMVARERISTEERESGAEEDESISRLLHYPLFQRGWNFFNSFAEQFEYFSIFEFLYPDAVQDILWYPSVVSAKISRALSIKFSFSDPEDHEADLSWTLRVMKECFTILTLALNTVAKSPEVDRTRIFLLLGEIALLEEGLAFEFPLRYKHGLICAQQ